MPGQTLTTEAIVLERRPPTDAFQTLSVFSPEHGNLLVLHRVSRRPSAKQVAPDLFDAVEALLESSNQGRTWFAKELRILGRRPGIGRSYDSLRFASALVAVIGRNPVHEDSRQAVAELLRTALDAFEAGTRPDVVHLKSLYVFARDEGYPVKQEWIPGLDPEERAVAVSVLNRPVGGQEAGAEAVARIRMSLETYLASNTEIVLP